MSPAMSAVVGPRYIAFSGHSFIAQGTAPTVAALVKKVMESSSKGELLVFDAATSQPVEWDLRGSDEDVEARLQSGNTAVQVALPETHSATETASPDGVDPEEHIRKGPGRKKLGVVGREVTLLPRHWDWLAAQPGVRQ